jgi:hypothetical protein
LVSPITQKITKKKWRKKKSSSSRSREIFSLGTNLTPRIPPPQKKPKKKKKEERTKCSLFQKQRKFSLPNLRSNTKQPLKNRKPEDAHKPSLQVFQTQVGQMQVGLSEPTPTSTPSTGCRLWLSCGWTLTEFISGFTLVTPFCKK